MNAIETSISTAVARFNNTNFVFPLSDQDLDESAHFTVSGGDDLTGLPVDYTLSLTLI